jgi:hypothetical protein
MALMAWTEIEGFSNIRKYTQAHPEIINGNSKVRYKAKVKLHGQNHAVQVHEGGKVLCQSRTTELSVTKDNEGFAKWVDANDNYWSCINGNTTLSGFGGWIVYGEWVGPGIQRGVALAELHKKVFAVFAARPLDDNDALMVNPDLLRNLVHGVPDTYVLDWYQDLMESTLLTVQFEIDWSLPDGQLSLITSQINEMVASVEKEDPWVKANFGITGTGEGLVFYPVSKEHTGYANFCNLTFKAKGEAHKNIKTAKPAQVNAEAAASVDAFISMVLTEARLEQGAQAVQVRDGSSLFILKQTGEFVKWICADVQKEAQDELEASKLTWAQVQKPLSEKTRQWYLGKAKP